MALEDNDRATVPPLTGILSRPDGGGRPGQGRIRDPKVAEPLPVRLSPGEYDETGFLAVRPSGDIDEAV